MQKFVLNKRVTTALALQVLIRLDRGTCQTPHDRTGKHFLELRASGFARAMKEDEPVEVQLSEKITRPFDLFVRRMTKVKASDNRTDCDMRHGTAEGLDGIGDARMTTTSHKNAVFRQQRLLPCRTKCVRPRARSAATIHVRRQNHPPPGCQRCP